MKLSTRSTYGLRALVELALSAGHGPGSAAAIAQRHHLSVAYLEQLLHRLKRQGVVTSARGPRGGYLLARTPEQTTIADVVQVLDGSTEAEHSGTNGSRRPVIINGLSRDASRHAQRIAQAVWRGVHERLLQSLASITLQDLCDEVRTQAGEPLDHRYVFHI